MADITITIEEPVEDLVFKLNARRTLDGDIIVRDHPDVDIVVMTTRKKVIAFPKESLATTPSKIFEDPAAFDKHSSTDSSSVTSQTKYSTFAL